MYYIMDMPFASKEEAPDFGTITMVYAGMPQLGYIRQGGCIFRCYTFLSKDISKLNQINNAADGSKALAVDTGDVYILCDQNWYKQPISSGGGSSPDSGTSDDTWSPL